MHESFNSRKVNCWCLKLPPGKARRHFNETEFSLWTGEGTSHKLAQKTLPSSFSRMLPFKVDWGYAWDGKQFLLRPEQQGAGMVSYFFRALGMLSMQGGALLCCGSAWGPDWVWTCLPSTPASSHCHHLSLLTHTAYTQTAVTDSLAIYYRE